MAEQRRPPMIRAMFYDEDPDITDIQETLSRWKHGYAVRTIFHRLSDNSFWAVSHFENIDDDEGAGLEEGNYTIQEVRPRDVIATDFIPAHSN